MESLAAHTLAVLVPSHLFEVRLEVTIKSLSRDKSLYKYLYILQIETFQQILNILRGENVAVIITS